MSVCVCVFIFVCVWVGLPNAAIPRVYLQPADVMTHHLTTHQDDIEVSATRRALSAVDEQAMRERYRDTKLHQLQAQCDLLRDRQVELQAEMKDISESTPAVRDLSKERIKQIRAELCDINNRIRRTPLLEKAVEDVLALTAPITDDTPALFRITTHVKMQGGQSVPHLPSPLAYYRRIQVSVRGQIETRVIDLANYGVRQYTEDSWLKVVATSLNVSRQAALDHLDSHAMISDFRMFPGEHRLVYWGNDGPTLNTWRGYTAVPRPYGRATGLAYVPETAIWFYTALTRICGGNIALFKRFVSWCCFLFQNPLEKCGLALVLVSGVQGAGKNSIIAPLDAIIGCHSRVEATLSRVVKENNGFLAEMKIVFVDEAADARADAAAENLAKVQSLITESAAVTKKLYQNSQEGASYTAFVFLSNSTDAGLRFKSTLRRFQFLPVVEKRLWGNVGQALKAPRNRDAFYGQLLHTFLTLKHDDQLHHTIDTISANAALRKGFEESYPIITAIYPLCVGAENAVHSSFMGVRNYCDHKKHATRDDKDLTPEQKLALDARRRQENDAFCDEAIANGYFLMPRSTAIRRLLAQYTGASKANQPDVSHMIGSFNVRIGSTPPELLVSLCGISEFATGDLRHDAANIGSNAIIPTTHAGWRMFLSWSTGQSWEAIEKACSMDIAGEVNSASIPYITDEQLAELDEYGEEMHDSGWRDIASMIRHCQQNAYNSVGVFANRHLPPTAPMLLSSGEMAGVPGDGQNETVTKLFRARHTLLEIIHRCATDGQLGGKDKALAELLIDNILSKACYILAKAIESDSTMHPGYLILEAMQHVCPLHDGLTADGYRHFIEARGCDDKNVCYDIVTSPNFPDLGEVEDDVVSDANGWERICLESQLSRRDAAFASSSLEEFQRELREAFAGFDLLLRRVDSCVAGHPASNRALTLHKFFNVCIPAASPLTPEDALDFMFGEVNKLKDVQSPNSFWNRQKDANQYALVIKPGWIDEIWEFFHRCARTAFVPEGFVRKRREDPGYEKGWFEVFLLWETSVKDSQSQSM